MDDLLKNFVGNSFFSRSFFAKIRVFCCCFFPSKIWLSRLFLNKDKDTTTKTMQKEVNVTRLFGLRPYEIHWIIFGGWLGELVPQWLCWCNFSWGTFGEKVLQDVFFFVREISWLYMIGFLSSCLCVDWRFFGRKSLTPTKSRMRIREGDGKKAPIFRCRKCILFWGGGPEEKNISSFFVLHRP